MRSHAETTYPTNNEQIFQLQQSNESSGNKNHSSDDEITKIALFIDMDGTTIIQEIDHYLRYAWKNPRSSLRASLVDCLQYACDQNSHKNTQFDIIICTARPQIIESLLRLNVGSKPTKEVQDLLALSGCKVKKILRTSSLDKQLKGRILADFMRLNPDYREGILLDDQKKQKDNVDQMKIDKLKAFDINSAEDMDKFIQLIGYSSIYTPHNIITFVINNFKLPDETKNLNYGVTDEEKMQWLILQNYKIITEPNKLLSSHTTLLSSYKRHQFYMFTHTINHTKEIKLILKIIDDLALMLYETRFSEYEPKLDQIIKKADFIRNILLILEKDQYPTLETLNKYKTYFEKELLRSKIPNSQCDKNIQELLDTLFTQKGYSKEPSVTKLWDYTLARYTYLSKKVNIPQKRHDKFLEILSNASKFLK